MKVFISWSGDRSKKVAELLDDWIQCVIQAVDPWMSSKDIDRGAMWFNEINMELFNTSIGIVCLTKENKDKPWILFEAGALAKGLSSNRVCTFLIDLESTDLQDPLSQFNHSFPTHDSLYFLVRTINSSLKENALKQDVLEKVFNTYWPQFEKGFAQIIKSTPEEEVQVKRDEKDIMLDVLTTVRLLDRRMRTIENASVHSRDVTQGIANVVSANQFDDAQTNGEHIESLSHYAKFLIAKGMSRNEIVDRLWKKGLGLERAANMVDSFL